MAYQLVIEDKTDYLRVEVSGERLQGKEAQDAIQVWARVAEACRECEVSRVLATLDLTGRLPTMRAFEIAEDPESFGWSRQFKMAVVDLNESSQEDNLFMETVALNRGFAQKIFDNEADAKACLFQTR